MMEAGPNQRLWGSRHCTNQDRKEFQTASVAQFHQKKAEGLLTCVLGVEYQVKLLLASLFVLKRMQIGPDGHHMMQMQQERKVLELLRDMTKNESDSADIDFEICLSENFLRPEHNLFFFRRRSDQIFLEQSLDQFLAPTLKVQEGGRSWLVYLTLDPPTADGVVEVVVAVD